MASCFDVFSSRQRSVGYFFAFFFLGPEEVLGLYFSKGGKEHPWVCELLVTFLRFFFGGFIGFLRFFLMFLRTPGDFFIPWAFLKHPLGKMFFKCFSIGFGLRQLQVTFASNETPYVALETMQG